MVVCGVCLVPNGLAIVYLLYCVTSVEDAFKDPDWATGKRVNIVQPNLLEHYRVRGVIVRYVLDDGLPQVVSLLVKL